MNGSRARAELARAGAAAASRHVFHLCHPLFVSDGAIIRRCYATADAGSGLARTMISFASRTKASGSATRTIRRTGALFNWRTISSKVSRSLVTVIPPSAAIGL